MNSADLAAGSESVLREFRKRGVGQTMKKLLPSFALLGLSVASAATYRVTFHETAVVAGKELKPGDYKVELKDNKAVITNRKESVEADVTVETDGHKYDSTSVKYRNGDGKYRVQEIRIGGTNTKVVFN
jgi:hypothetical protein